MRKVQILPKDSVVAAQPWLSTWARVRSRGAHPFLALVLVSFLSGGFGSALGETVGFEVDEDFIEGPIEFSPNGLIQAEGVSLTIRNDDSDHGQVLAIESEDGEGWLALSVVDPARGEGLVAFEVAGSRGAVERLEMGDVSYEFPADGAGAAWRRFEFRRSSQSRREVFLEGESLGVLSEDALATFRFLPGAGQLRLDQLSWETLKQDSTQPSGIAVNLFPPLPPIPSGPTGVYREVWLDVGSSKLSRLRQSDDFPSAPSFADVLPQFEAPSNWANAYGTRLRAFLTPLVSGAYTFWIAGDDQSELWLSPNEQVSGAELIASVPSWTKSRQWGRFPEQQSEVVELVAGQQYYIEALHKEGWGGDNLAVAWAGPGMPEPIVIAGPFLKPFAEGSPYVGNPEFILNAGPDQILYLPRREFSLHGKARNLANPEEEAPVEWRSIGNAGASLGSPTTLVCEGTVPTFGEYLFELKATVNGKIYTDTVKLTVYPALAPDVGGVTREAWFDIKGNRVEHLLLDPRFPNHPDALDQLPSLEGPVNWANRFGTLARAFLHVPVSGNYTFWIAGDDTAVLSLSADAEPANAVPVAQAPGGTRQYQIDRYPDQQSEPVRLNAGQPYYIEVAHKDNWGGDHFSVFWQGPLSAKPEPLGGEFLSPFREAPAFDPAATLVALAGKDRVLHSPRRSVALRGGFRYLKESEREPSASWSQLSGPAGVLFGAASEFETEASFPGEGDYILQLLLDDGVEQALDQIHIRILPPLADDVGGITRELWLGIKGRKVEDLLKSAAYSGPADVADQMSRFALPSNWNDNYGTRLRGYLIPPATGTYDLSVASDDYSELWLSPTTDPAQAERIALVNAWLNPNQWERRKSQRASVELTAGQRYYIEALYKESGGKDHFSVGWIGPGIPDREVIDGGYLVPFQPAPPHQGELEILLFGQRSIYWPQSLINVATRVFDLSPGPNDVTVNWSGDPSVVFGSPNQFETSVRFLGPGRYTLRLAADDGQHQREAVMDVAVLEPLSADVGGVTRDVWFGVSSSKLSKLRDDPRFPKRPFLRDELPRLATPIDWGQSYGTRLRAYLQVPVSGNYVFWISGDDQSELWLSRDQAPGNSTLIASVPSWTRVAQWERYDSQQSSPIPLVAGQRYYLEVLHKEGGGGDHVEVAWQGPGIPERQVIEGGFLSPFLPAPPANPALPFLVNAGLDQIHYLPQQEFELEGDFAMPQGEAPADLSFEWRLVPPGVAAHVQIVAPNELQTPLRVTAAGRYEFELVGRSGEHEHVDQMILEIGPALAPETGSLLREVWLDVRGKMVESLFESERFAMGPTLRDEIGRFEGPANWANNYAVRYRGYLHVPVAGDYTFYLSSDDYSRLWLSSSDSPNNVSEIAMVNSSNRVRDWHRKPHQMSAPIPLQPGQRYYIEAVHKESSSSDHFAVGWMGPQLPEPAVIEGGFLSPFESAPAFDPQIQLLTLPHYDMVWPESEIDLFGLAFDLRKGPNPLSYSWQVINGGNVRFSMMDSQTTTASFDGPGHYSLRFGVSDGLHQVFRDIPIAIAPAAGSGESGLLREVWLDVGGVRIDQLVDHERFPSQPSLTDRVPSFSTPLHWQDDYGTRLRGYLHPPATDTYTLWLSGDDHSQLWFGRDGTDANAELIASIEGWTSFQRWDRYPTQRSVPLDLVAGEKYYVEVLHKERRGEDHVEVGWTHSTQSEPTIIPGGYLTPYAPAPLREDEVVVIAGPDRELTWPDHLLELDGRVIDLLPGPFQLQTQWSEVGGGTVTFTQEHAASTLALFPGPGTYVLQLEASDGEHTRSDQREVIIHPPAAPDGGIVLREVYQGISGSRLRHLRASEKFPDFPDQRTVLTSLEGPTNVMNNYGTRIRGYLHPPSDGVYHFWLAGDDESELWLSDSEDPAGAQRIAHVPSWSRSREWERFPEQASSPIQLVAGQRYFFEVLHKEGGGGDNLAVAWDGPSIGGRRVIAGAFLSPFSASNDTEPPSIQLTGESVLNVPAGVPFSDPGYQAVDNVDGDLTESVDVIGEVDSMQVGRYHLIYLVRDRSGNAAVPGIREVNVVRSSGNGTNANWPPGPPPGFTPPAPSGWTLPNAVSDQDAGRFLTQATFGPSEAEIRRVQQMGFSGWVDEQLALAPSLHLPHLREKMALLGDGLYGPSPTNPMPREARVDDRMYTWWTHAIEAPDQLRQRMAFALSEILVVSDRSPALRNHTEAVTHYYDILVRNALGNYRNLIEEVSLSPVMGIYLTVLRNTKADPETGTMPDENYARELLQLFSIGLKQLNPDGSDQTDANGAPLVTYGMGEILAFARVFTGWTLNGSRDFFWTPRGQADLLSPMMAFEEWHDTDPKVLLGGVELPGHQTAYEDLSDALDNIFHHPNVGPFIARALIQRLVTSNPSRGYIYRVAAAFDDNGQGVRGDLGAVARAIVLDEEARDLSRVEPDTFGKQKEPLLRLSHLIRAFYEFQTDSPPTLGRIGFGSSLNGPLGQAPLYAPSVFNFFDRDYSPSGVIQDRGLVAPEFQITSEVRAIDGANFFHSGVSRGFRPGSGFIDWIRLNLIEALAATSDVNSVLDYLDRVLMANSMSPAVRAALHATLTEINSDSEFQLESAIQLIVTSPQFTIQR